MIEIPRESIEVLATTVQDDGNDVTDYQVAVVANGTRPVPEDAWGDPVVAGEHRGPRVDGLVKGAPYDVFARYGTGDPERPVILLGSFVLT